MRLQTKRKTTADDVRRVALAALVTALDDRKQEAKDKPGLTGARAVATGAVIYTAGRAALKGGRFVREHFVAGRNDGEAVDEDEERDDPEAEEEDFDEDEEREEPEADEEDFDEDEEREEPEADEQDFDEDEERDEPEAEEEDFDEDEERDEPEAEGDEDFDDDEPDDDERWDDDEPEDRPGPEGADDEQFEDEDEDEPEAESRDDDDREYADEDDERPPTPDLQPLRRAARGKRKQPSLVLPQRPSRSRSPLARS
jgi:hypothetical protein